MSSMIKILLDAVADLCIILSLHKTGQNDSFIAEDDESPPAHRVQAKTI